MSVARFPSARGTLAAGLSIALVLAATLAACGVQPTSGPRGGECTYPGASPQCRGINPG